MYARNCYRKVQDSVVYARRKSERVEMYNIGSCLKKYGTILERATMQLLMMTIFIKKIITFW